jgi:predicted regulator of Ras-like GTPase activity (Roadblock/LC7/MglB family)
MDAAQALAELTELSSQVQRAVVLDPGGAVLGSTGDDTPAAQALAQAALDLVAAAGELHASSDQVTRAEVELAEGSLFVIREGGKTIAATTGPRPTAGLVAYDLRTCLQRIQEEKPKRKRAAKKPKESQETGESQESQESQE